jgi:hypothetical protein
VQPLVPEAASNGGAAVPRRAPTRARPARLWDGHLTAECSLRGGGAPACPACLTAALQQQQQGGRLSSA